MDNAMTSHGTCVQLRVYIPLVLYQPVPLSLLIALRLFLHLIVSDKQPSPEDMSERCRLLVRRGKRSLSPSVACALRCSNILCCWSRSLLG